MWVTFRCLSYSGVPLVQVSDMSPPKLSLSSIVSLCWHGFADLHHSVSYPFSCFSVCRWSKWSDQTQWNQPMLSYAGDSRGVLGGALAAGGGARRSAVGAPQQEAQHPLCAHRWAAPTPLHQVHKSPGTQEQGQECCSPPRVRSSSLYSQYHQNLFYSIVRYIICDQCFIMASVFVQAQNHDCWS